MNNIGYLVDNKCDIPKVMGVCGDKSMFWVRSELVMLQALAFVTDGLDLTDDSRLAFYYLFPLHTAEDVVSMASYLRGKGKLMTKNKFSNLFTSLIDMEEVSRFAHCDFASISKDGVFYTIDYLECTTKNFVTTISYLIERTRSDKTQLRKRFLCYVSQRFGVSSTADVLSLKYDKILSTTGSIKTTLDGFTLSAPAMLFKRTDFTPAEYSIIFNNRSLSIFQLANLLPDRSLDAISSAVSALDIVMYKYDPNYDTVVFNRESAILDDTTGGVYIITNGDALRAFMHVYFHIDLKVQTIVDMKTTKKKVNTVKGSVKNKNVKDASNTDSIDLLSSALDKVKGDNKSKPKTKKAKTTKEPKVSVDVTKFLEEVNAKIANKEDGCMSYYFDEVRNALKELAVSSIKLYTNGTPWTYAELYFMLTHTEDVCTPEVFKAISGIKRTKTEIKSKYKYLKELGVSDIDYFNL